MKYLALTLATVMSTVHASDPTEPLLHVEMSDVTNAVDRYASLCADLRAQYGDRFKRPKSLLFTAETQDGSTVTIHGHCPDPIDDD